MNPRPLGYEQAERRRNPSRPVAYAHAGLSLRRGAVSACLTMSGSLRGVLVTTMVTPSAGYRFRQGRWRLPQGPGDVSRSPRPTGGQPPSVILHESDVAGAADATEQSRSVQEHPETDTHPAAAAISAAHGRCHPIRPADRRSPPDLGFIIVLPSSAIRLTPPSPATPARTTRVPTGVPARGRQAVFRPRRHLAGPNGTRQPRVTAPTPASRRLRCFFEEQRHEVRRPVRRPIRFLVDVGNSHQAARYVLSGRTGHAALDERIGAAELAHERRDRDLLISTGWP